VSELVDLTSLPSAEHEYEFNFSHYALEASDDDLTMSEAVVAGGSCDVVTDTSTHPFASVAFLQINIGTLGSKRGTGFFITDRLLLTAAHCVHSRFGAVTSIDVFPGLNGPGGGSITSTRFMPFDRYLIDPTDPANDFGVIFVPPGSSTLRFGFDFVPDNFLRALPLHLQGYPVGLTQQMFCTGPLKAISGALFSYNMPTNEGESGGPVWPDHATSAVAAGIHIGEMIGIPVARRVDQTVLQQIAAWVSS
jgi:glutamyl endopeptidase